MGSLLRRLANRSIVRLASLALVATALTGCISTSFYVDPGTRDVAAAEIRRPAEPKPVELVFEFQTKGAPNASATKTLQQQVTEQVVASGLFSAIDAKGGGMVSVVVNNVPQEDAASKGFTTGLTLGMAGSKVTDFYECTITYLPAGGGNQVSKTARHAIHTTIGNAAAPAGMVKSENIEAAVRTMLRQVVGNALQQLSLDPAMT